MLCCAAHFPNMKFNQYLLAPYFGSGLLPHGQTLWIDELAVGTDRLGPEECVFLRINNPSPFPDPARCGRVEVGQCKSTLCHLTGETVR